MRREVGGGEGGEEKGEGLGRRRKRRGPLRMSVTVGGGEGMLLGSLVVEGRGRTELEERRGRRMEGEADGQTNASVLVRESKERRKTRRHGCSVLLGGRRGRTGGGGGGIIYQALRCLCCVVWGDVVGD